MDSGGIPVLILSLSGFVLLTEHLVPLLIVRRDPERVLLVLLPSFDAVAKFLSSPDFGLLAQIRNSASFHYDKKRAGKGIERIVTKYPEHESVYSMGIDPLDWYFEIGDLVNDRIVVREIFAVSESVVDVRAAIDPILGRMHRMAAAFSDFAGNFIRFRLKR